MKNSSQALKCWKYPIWKPNAPHYPISVRWYQLTFKTFGPSKSIWYTFFHCYHWAHPIHFVHCHHLGHMMTLHVSWGQVQLTAQLWSMSFRFSGPLLDPTWLCPGARSCVPSLPALPTPPLMFSPMRGTCKSHIRNRCSHPTRRSGVKITCSHTCLICCSCEEPCSSSLKNQNIHIISCHPTQGKHDHLPFTKDRPKQNNL